MRSRRPTPLPSDVNVLALVKGTEKYVWTYTDQHKSDALNSIGRFAANPELSFTWYDAAILCQRIRKVTQ